MTLYGFGHTPAEPGRPFARARFDAAAYRSRSSTAATRSVARRTSARPRRSRREVSASGATLAPDRPLPRRLRRRPSGGARRSPIRLARTDQVRRGRGARRGGVRVEGEYRRADARPIARTRLFEIECDLSGVGHEHAVLAPSKRRSKRSVPRLRSHAPDGRSRRARASTRARSQERFEPASARSKLSIARSRTITNWSRASRPFAATSCAICSRSHAATTDCRRGACATRSRLSTARRSRREALDCTSTASGA